MQPAPRSSDPQRPDGTHRAGPGWSERLALLVSSGCGLLAVVMACVAVGLVIGVSFTALTADTGPGNYLPGPITPSGLEPATTPMSPSSLDPTTLDPTALDPTTLDSPAARAGSSTGMAGDVDLSTATGRRAALAAEAQADSALIERYFAITRLNGERCGALCRRALVRLERRAASDGLYAQIERTTWGRNLDGEPGRLRHPLPGAVFAGGLGWAVRPADGVYRYHDGVDLTLPTGTPVLAALGGVVTRCGPRAGYGLAVEIRHPDGTAALYTHLSEVLVATGDEVIDGAPVGLVGATGLAGSPHLHFEYRDVDGTKLNPLAYL